MRRIIITSAALLSLMLMGSAVAQTRFTYDSASNHCFPRVFSQINQFKVSNGGIFNEHPNPRTIICSVDTYGDLNPDNEYQDKLVSVWLKFSPLPAPMDCTAYARTNDGLALIDTVTRTFAAGVGGSAEHSVGTLDLDGNNLFTANLYLQCKVPGGGRIMRIHTYSEPGAP